MEMESDTEPNIIPGGSISRLGDCEVCAVQMAKYTCPQCEVKTCSLKCNKIHKAELDCCGRRDRTKFIPINKFTNLDLHSDYTLLEEISRSLETCRKKFGKKWYKSEFLNKLTNAARTRKVNLKILPYKFERRRCNTTFFKFKENTIYWHVEWIFVNADNLKMKDEKVSEQEKLSAILAKYFESPKDNIGEKLQFYQAVGLPGVKVLLKAEQKTNKFYEVDVTSTLKEILEGKLIVEYPTFHVVLRDHGNFYDVIDSDDEQFEKRKGVNKTGHEVLQKIIMKEESDNSMKNLLFTSGQSEDELSSD